MSTLVRALLLFCCFLVSVGGLAPVAFAQKPATGQIIISQESFISPDYSQTDQSTYQFIGGQIRSPYLQRDDVSGLLGDVTGLFSPQTPVLSYLNVSQLYWQDKELRFGRKKETWSQLDSNWLLGLYQPLFRWNPLDPQEQGLFGVYIDVSSREGSLFPWELTLMGSPLFIPDQGPGFEIENGEFKKNNPYFQAPPSEAIVLGQNDELNYNVNTPEMDQILMNRSFVLKAVFGDEKTGPSISLSSAYKPMNQLSLGFQGYLSANSSVEVDILPAVAFHRLYSADLYHRFQTFYFGLSFLSDQPESPELEPEWTYATYGKTEILSPTFGAKVFDIDFSMSWLEAKASPTIYSGTFAEQASDVIPERLPFEKAYKIRIFSELLKIRRNSILGTMAYTQASDRSWVLWTGSSQFIFEERWSAFMNFSLASVNQSESSRSSFLSPFANNDTLGMGVSYVF